MKKDKITFQKGIYNLNEEPNFTFQHLSKPFGTHEVLKDINFSVKKGEVVCILMLNQNNYQVVKNNV